MSEEPRIVLFALSTCNACRKTKDLLDGLGINYIGADLDTVDIDSRNELMEKVRKYNPRETFPTLVVDGGKAVVVGYSEEEIKEALNIS